MKARLLSWSALPPSIIIMNVLLQPIKEDTLHLASQQLRSLIPDVRDPKTGPSNFCHSSLKANN